jgi:hypothetical protein
MHRTTSLLPHRRLAAAGLACLLFSATAWAAGPATSAQSLAQYRQDMAVCNSGRSHQAVPTCRLEARNAFADNRRGRLTDAPGTYQENALQRCKALEGIDRTACESRMRGEGRMEGSVHGGGILRESVMVVPAK